MSAVLDRDRVRADLVARGLGDHADALLALVEPSVVLEGHPAVDEELPVASTKLGGCPDLATGSSWPEFRGRPQSFIAQVNLADVAHLSVARALPESGLLSFFYDSEQSIWGYDPQDRHGWTVWYSPTIDGLRRTPFPSTMPDHGRYAVRRLSPRIELTFVPWESADVDRLGMSREQLFAYAEAVPEGGGVKHRLLGHPDPIQGDMQLEAQLAFHGLYCGDPSGYADPRASSLRGDAVQWRLLLQIDSDDAAGMMWGDVGRIYYWIRREDLTARRFGDSWMILQCS